MLVARVRKQGRNHKLLNTWTEPWRVEKDEKEHIRTVGNIITGETREVHVTRMRFYADSDLKITKAVKDVFQQGEYHIGGITEVKKANRGDEYVVLVQWEGLDDAEETWEPVSRVLEDAPTVLRRELRKIKPPAAIKRELQHRYNINI